METKKKLLIVSIFIPLAVGILSSILSGGGMADFQVLKRPPLSPPGWLFPVVWTVLYVLMGIASWLIIMSEANEEDRYRALFFYGLQLAVNFFWSIFFFRFDWYLFSFFWLILLWLLIVQTWRLFREISVPAGRLLVPYLLWVTFAGYLNLFIFLLNR